MPILLANPGIRSYTQLLCALRHVSRELLGYHSQAELHCRRAGNTGHTNPSEDYHANHNQECITKNPRIVLLSDSTSELYGNAMCHWSCYVTEGPWVYQSQTDAHR